MTDLQLETLKKITSEIIGEQERIQKIRNLKLNTNNFTYFHHHKELDTFFCLFKNQNKIKQLLLDLLQKEIDEHNEKLKNLSALDIAMKLEKGN